MSSPGPTPDWLRVRELFERLVDASDERRIEVLGAENPGAEERREVERLLRLHDRSDSEFLQPMASSGDEGTSLVGQKVGKYRITGKIAEGGMGVVYLARQERPDRMVALKVMRLEFATSEARRRFDYESEILGRLTHPGIAHVHEAGSFRSPFGDYQIPFIAMEFVPEARTIFDHTRGLDVDAKVSLFREVCEAIHYGHQNGVIHRDLKPSNILIDDSGRARIIDFGIAKMTGPEQTLTLVSGQVTGTLRYMSPEQLESKPVDIRTDVYSLGLVMYEVLCGEPAFEVTGLPMSQAMQVIGKSDPMALAVAQPDLPPDLQWIVSKAIDKDPARRYQTMHDLALDLGRLQNHETVTATPPSLAYTVKKFVRRNRTQVAAAALVLISLVAGLVFSTVQYFNAQERATESESVTQVLLDLFDFGEPTSAAGEYLPARALIDASVHRVNNQLQDQPRIRGRLLNALATAYLGLGLDQKCLQTAEQGIEVLEQQGEGTDVQWDLGVYVATSLSGLGKTQEAEARTDDLIRTARAMGRPDLVARGQHLLGTVKQEAGAVAEAKIIMANALSEIEKHSAKNASYRAHARLRFAAILFDNGEPAAAAVQLARTLEVIRKAAPGGHPALVSALASHARCQVVLGKIPEALILADEAVAESLRTFGANHPDHAKILRNRAHVRRHNGQQASAVTDLQRSLAIKEQYLSPDHPQLAWTLNDLAVQLHELGRLKEAKSVFDRALRIHAVAHPQGHRDRIICIRNKAELCAQVNGSQDEGRRLAEAALAMADKVGIPDAEHGLCKVTLSYYLNIANETQRALTLALEALSQVPEWDHRNSIYIARANYYVAWAEMTNRRFARAEPYFKKSIQLFRRIFPNGHPIMAFPLGHYAHGLRQNRIEEAIPLFEEALAIRRKHLPASDSWRITNARQLGSAYMQTAAYEKAVAPLQEAFDALEQHYPPEDPRYRPVGDLLIDAYEKARQPDQARKIRTRMARRNRDR